MAPPETLVERLSAGLTRTLAPQPCTLVIFGGGGDLSKRKLLPGLYNLMVDGVLPARFAAIGFGKNTLSDEAYRGFAREGIVKFSRREIDEGAWDSFARSLFFQAGSFEDPQAYEALRQRLQAVDSQFGIPGNHIFYLAIPPDFITTCVGSLQRAGLITNAADRSFTRVIVEKPIGHDLESARKINDALAKELDERQIFRIDHYLGKETVQNILVLRFANSIFEPLFNQKYIDHVQITVAEEEGVGTRAGYYEGAGALRDMVQNHILQLLTLVAMEPPWSLEPDVVRDARLEVLRSLRPLCDEEIDRHVVRAQYGAGYVAGKSVPGYRREEGVRSDSTTETYVALEVHVDNWRWAGVPFYMRTGKRLPKRVSEISIQLKEVPRILFNADPAGKLDPNILSLRIQPDEGFSLRISSKVPGAKVKIYPVVMDFHYGTTFGNTSPEAYERLLLDVMAGDATLFMRRDAVEASWSFVQCILDRWNARPERWLPEYPAGHWGPIEADRLIEHDGRRWWML
jgi:glucose-6-phosphate 1-dehydrogenase